MVLSTVVRLVAALICAKEKNWTHTLPIIPSMTESATLVMERMTSAEFFDFAGMPSESIRFIRLLIIILSQDIAFVRRGRGLEERVQKEGPSQGLKCQVKYWSDAWEIEEYFAQL